jgi:RNA polymerase sigma-70 factor (ECF subfamily)
MGQSENKPPPKADSRLPERKTAFTTTHWSVVLEASHENSAAAKEALECLCRTYWYPLYAFIRRRGSNPHEAEDLTQAFFVHVFERDALKTVSPEKGKFRSFLLTALANFLNDQYQKSRAWKRGGGVLLESWDATDAEERYRHEPVDNITPERLFERRWAFTIVEQVLANLRQEYRTGGKLNVFEALQPFLVGPGDPGFTAAAAAQLEMNEGAVKVALHRLRRRFGCYLRAEIASTVASPDQVEEESRYLLSVLSD